MSKETHLRFINQSGPESLPYQQHSPYPEGRCSPARLQPRCSPNQRSERIGFSFDDGKARVLRRPVTCAGHIVRRKNAEKARMFLFERLNSFVD